MKRYVIRRVRLGAAFLGVLVLVAGVQLLRPQETVTAAARLVDQVLVIDPGHGGVDGGAVSRAGEKESDVNLSISLALDELMGFYGVPTQLTRRTDESIHDPEAATIREQKVSDLQNRVKLVNSLENATLISIHQNSYPSQQQHGTQVFYGKHPLSLPLAQEIQDTVRRALDQSNERTPRPVPTSVYFLNRVSCRTVLVECGFLSNPAEAERLQERAYQMKLAMVIAAGYLSCGDTQEGEGLV